MEIRASVTRPCRVSVGLGAVLLFAAAVLAGCASADAITSTSGALTPTTVSSGPAPSVIMTAHQVGTATITSTTSEPAQILLGWGETATVPRLVAITASSPQLDMAAKHVPPTLLNSVVLYCVVTIKNLAGQPLAYDQADFDLVAPHEEWSGGQVAVETTKGRPLLSGILAPGETVTGLIPFQFSIKGASAINYLVYHGPEKGAPYSATIQWQNPETS